MTPVSPSCVTALLQSIQDLVDNARNLQGAVKSLFSATRSACRGRPRSAGDELPFSGVKELNYLMIPIAFRGNRLTSSLAMPKLSAINDAGFPASHLEIEISSNAGLLNRAKNFVGTLPTCSTK